MLYGTNAVQMSALPPKTAAAMPTIAYLVSKNYDEIIERAKIFQDEHAVLRPHFEKLGFQCERADWQDPSVDWDRYACLLPKAVWNYFDCSAEFAKFLESLRAARVPMQNPIESVLWNMDKRYLLDFIEKGQPTIPVTIYPRDSRPGETWFSGFGASQILVKPSISGGSKNTIRFAANKWRDHLETLNTILREGDLIVQPFVTEVETEGEYSFFFFGGTFSHAIIKKPLAGDFRAHSFFGADLRPYLPTSEEIAAAYEFVLSAPTPCPYARVDLIRVKNVLQLVELEIIEPYLYLEYSSQGNAAQAFATGLVSSIRAR